MHETIELFIIALTSFILAFFGYIIMAMNYYKRKINKLKNMAPTVTDMIIKSLDEIKKQQAEIFNRLNQLDVMVAKIKVKMVVYASLIGSLTSGVMAYLFKQL